MMIIGNEDFVDTFINELKTRPGVWYVTGPSQSGRSKLCSISFDRAGLDCVTIMNESGSVKDLARNMEPHRDTMTISSFFTSKPRLLFLDDFDIYGVEKGIQTYISDFFKHPNFASSNLRVVMVISRIHEKYFKDMTSKIGLLRIQNPSPLEAFEYVSTLHPTLDKFRLEQLCNDMQGNIGGILSRVCFLDQYDRHSVLIKDRTAHDMLHMLFQGMIPPADSDVLYSYDPKIMAMLYFDNMNRYIKSSGQREKMATYLADMHILEEKMYGTGYSGVVASIWCQLLCSQPVLTDKRFPDTPYDHTRILCRTANRCNLNKRIYKMLQDIGIDQNSREVVFDVLSDIVLTQTCKGVDEATYTLCKEYLQTVGGIKKEYIDKYQIKET